MKTLVLGIGNVLLRDEGVGVHVARALQQEQLPPDVTPLEVGTAFLDALPAIEQAERLIIVDAMMAGQRPGTIYRLPVEDCARPERLASLHGFDITRVIFLTGEQLLPEAVVIGVEPSRIDWGMELSPEIQDVVPDVIEAIKGELVLST